VAPLIDTAVAASLLNTAPGAFAAHRRGQDYYDEGMLIWLEADAVIRAATHGKRSLDDFARAFFGGAGAAVVPYTRADVVAALGKVQPDDWEGFSPRASTSVRPRTARRDDTVRLDAGWRDSSSEYFDALESEFGGADYRFSLGLHRRSGSLGDMLPIRRPRARTRAGREADRGRRPHLVEDRARRRARCDRLVARDFDVARALRSGRDRGHRRERRLRAHAGSPTPAGRGSRC
jgi:hypothetical protein